MVFDLDDTLYKEHDYVVSGFRAVAEFVCPNGSDELYDSMLGLYSAGEHDVFSVVIDRHRLAVAKREMVRVYRSHQPSIKLDQQVGELLDHLSGLGHPLALISDGRSATQRRKIAALGLERWLDEVVISEEIGAEKPSERGFRHMRQRFGDRPYVYIGDNPGKDFLAPNALGWTSVCVRADERNIHPQCFGALTKEYLPDYLIERLAGGH